MYGVFSISERSEVPIMSYRHRSIPVELLMKCDNCNRTLFTIRWYPEDHYEQLAKVEVIPCRSCNLRKSKGTYHTVTYKKLEPKLRKIKNVLYLEIGGKRRAILVYDPPNVFELFLKGLSDLGFIGDLSIKGFHTTINEFKFCKDGIIIGKEKEV